MPKAPKAHPPRNHLASRLREAAEALGPPVKATMSLRQAAEELGPGSPPVSRQPGTSYSRVPGQPGTRPYQDRPSQAVASMDYDYQGKNLYVSYTTGSRYLYSGVPQDVYMGFATASSKGQYVNSVIKPGYRCKFISGNRKRAVSCP